MLDGARMVTCSETGEGRHLDESTVKAATGGDPITARFLNREFFDFRPQFKAIMLTNHKPIIRGTDHGIWRRVHLVPFVVTIPATERDPDLPAKLRAEAEGILGWMLDGFRSWQAGGLRPPETVRAATDAYKSEMDVLAEFLDESCLCGLDEGPTKNSALYSAFVSWCKDNGEFVRSHRWFTRALKERGVQQDPARTHGRAWLGVRLLVSSPSESRWGGYQD